jgi:hypothetical protein
MNIMKRILTFSIVLICTMGFSTLVSAQGTGTDPAIGFSHSYWVNSEDGTALKTGYPTGNKYLWYITKSDLTAVNTSDFTITTAAYVDATTEVNNLYKIDIIWNAASAGSTYYLHVIETDGTTSCSNHKVEIIKPISDFQLAIANVDETALGTVVEQDFENCAPNVTPVLVSDAVRYNYGTTKLYYKVDAKNIDAANFDFEYNIAKTGGPTAVSATYGTVSGSTYSSIGALTVDGADHTQTITNTATNYIFYIEVILDNNNGDNTDFATANVFEGLSVHNVRVTLISGTQSAATATITDGNDTTTDDNYRNQNILARPGTSQIGSN